VDVVPPVVAALRKIDPIDVSLLLDTCELFSNSILLIFLFYFLISVDSETDSYS
jgi:hypothetical protein